MNLNNSSHIRWNNSLDRKVAELYATGMVVKDIAIRLGLPEGATSARLSVLGVTGNRRPPAATFTFTGYTPELAYLLGAWLTDGWTTRGQIGIAANDQDFVENYARCLSSVLHREYQIRKRYDERSRQGFLWTTAVSSWDLSRWLIEQTRNKTQLPDNLADASETIRLEFLAGAMDGDGYISRGTKEKNGIAYEVFSIGFCGGDIFVPEVARMMQQIGIVVGKRIVDHREPPHKDIHIYRFNPKSVAFSPFHFGIQRKNSKLLLLKQKYLPQRLNVGASEI